MLLAGMSCDVPFGVPHATMQMEGARFQNDVRVMDCSVMTDAILFVLPFTRLARVTLKWESWAWRCDAAYGHCCCGDAHSLAFLVHREGAGRGMLEPWKALLVVQEPLGEMGRRVRRRNRRQTDRRR